MKNTILVLLCFLTLQMLAFQGEIVLNYSNFNAGDMKVDKVTWTFKDNQSKMSMVMTDPNGKVASSSFIPQKSSESLLIYSNTAAADGKNYYYQVPLSKIEDTKKSDYRAEKTSESKVILGYTCTKYLVYSSSTITEMWVASSIDVNYGTWANFYKTNAEMQGLKLLGIVGFPLESTTKSLAGNIIFQYTTSSVMSKTLDDKEFQVPANYVLATNEH